MFDHIMLHYPQSQRPTMAENRWKPAIEIAPNCPRCASPNTKFCYYNNYSLSQPRYFCKACRRYWTKGGSLRNVPVGGGCRKNRRSRSGRHSQSGSSNLGYISNPICSDELAVNSPERANINLADVFAKFLNQNSSQQNEEINVGDDSSSGSGLPLCDSTDEAELQNVVVPPFMSEEDHEIEEFMVQNTNLLDIQDILNEDLSQDVSWSDETTTLSSFAWEQDFEPFVCNTDDLNISTDVVTGNWNPTSVDQFDLPAIGNFFQSF